MVVKRVLVIDDEDDIREVAKLSLKVMAGIDVILAGTSGEGLAKAEAEQPDAILLDVMLPDMDGVVTFQRLQSNPATQHIPVILLTAKVHASDQRRFANLGVKAMITKPFKPAKLAEQLLSVLGWSAGTTSGSN
ncbi:two-component system response regulator [Leptolyngbya sp. 'hensonii']|uniref:response regulator n=1 Tax=Leptolyngbya sp. 'hensonii' TaxID=1922337 RepID=UPI00094FFFF1|nr:response regulator [Leptolyngbya sp. 'hensonii']OLP18044.1 two-component system response regulator [Leptolyngbya sp. 'hensonii']